MKRRPAGELKDAILKALANGPVAIAHIRIAARPSSPDSVHEALRRMIRRGTICRTEKGVYALCPECDAPTVETVFGGGLACSRGSECPACWSATDAEAAPQPSVTRQPERDGTDLARLADRLAVLCRARDVSRESLALVDRAVRDTAAAIAKAAP